MKAIKMSIYSLKNVDEKEQLAFVHKMYTYPYEDGHKAKLGVLEKFSNSIGFKPVDWHYDKNESNYIEEQVKSPKGYISPSSLLMRSTCFFNEKNELLSFVIGIKQFEHSDSRYSYNTLELILKFQEYLYKVYGDHIKIRFKAMNSDKLDTKVWLLGHFYTVVAMGEHYETECALGKMLTKRERKYVLDNISRYVSYKCDIRQYYCETYESHDKKAPYHTELIDLEREKAWEQEDIKEGLYARYLKDDARWHLI